jgi:predicted RNase H-like HicB family nuclease
MGGKGAPDPGPLFRIAGRVTIAGKPSDDLAPRLVEQHIEASRPQGEPVMRYAVVIEKAGRNFSAYVPDLPGCVATGSTREEAENEIREAIRFHLDGLKEDGLPAPPPQATLTYVET